MEPVTGRTTENQEAERSSSRLGRWSDRISSWRKSARRAFDRAAHNAALDPVDRDDEGAKDTDENTRH